MGGFLLENWLCMNFRGGQLSKVVTMATCVITAKDGWISIIWVDTANMAS